MKLWSDNISSLEKNSNLEVNDILKRIKSKGKSPHPKIFHIWRKILDVIVSHFNLHIFCTLTFLFLPEFTCICTLLFYKWDKNQIVRFRNSIQSFPAQHTTLYGNPILKQTSLQLPSSGISAHESMQTRGSELLTHQSPFPFHCENLGGGRHC